DRRAIFRRQNVPGDQHRAMRLRAGDVLGIKALVEIDRGSDAAHDFRRTAGKATAPQRIRRCACRGIGRPFRTGHRVPLQAQGKDETMRWAWAGAALMILLVASGASSAAESRADTPDRTPL